MKAFSLSRILPTLVLALSISSLAWAQGPPAGGVIPLNPIGVPIDGGVSLLLAGGVALGIKKLRNRRKVA